jgi:hypothetical protein
MALRTSLFLWAGVLCTLFASCGGDSERETSTADATKTAATKTAATKTAAPPNLEKYLLQADEVPGLEPIESPRTDSGPPFDLPADGAERLRRSGYISTTYQPAGGDGAGVSSVLPFETEAGARDWMDYETQVYWTQGRCMMLIGLEVEGPRVERLSAGAEAVYERTDGTCPE